jgi:hypothetical protein
MITSHDTAQGADHNQSATQEVAPAHFTNQVADYDDYNHSSVDSKNATNNDGNDDGEATSRAR